MYGKNYPPNYDKSSQYMKNLYNYTEIIKQEDGNNYIDDPEDDMFGYRKTAIDKDLVK